MRIEHALTYITTTENSAATPIPAGAATCAVTFPAAGSYALYVRILVGPVGGNDDSFYIPPVLEDRDR